MPLRRFSPGLKAQFAFGMVFLFVQPDASAADISAQQIGGVIIPQAFSQALQDGMSVPLYIHLAGSQGRQDDQRIGSEVIRFFYKGPADEKERYYRIVWFDQALSDAQRDNANRSAVATASARIGTILVVAPRQANYHFQYANGSLTNTGNATLRILAYGPCLKAANGKECKENYYLMPGKSRRFTRVDTADNKGRVALWQGDKFIPVK